MKLEKAKNNQLERIVRMSKEAFETDIVAGGAPGDYPPGYDSMIWHDQMLREDHLYVAVEDDQIVGGAILFLNEDESLTIGRIFIDSAYHRKGFGISLMKCAETLFPDIKEIHLDTPIWNIRTNSFYKKTGYIELKQEAGFIFYKKRLK